MKHKKMSFEFYEHDIVLLLNCICLTKDILKIGKTELFEKYFKKEMFNTYMYDLTLIQKLIGYRANNIFYNFPDFDFFIGQRDYINLDSKDFKYLFGKQRQLRLKEISKEKMCMEKTLKANSNQNSININYFKKKWYLEI